jgi:hypothetical protein
LEMLSDRVDSPAGSSFRIEAEVFG